MGGYFGFYLSPIGRHIRHYGPAEQLVDDLVVPLRNDLLDGEDSIDSLLNLPKYRELKNRVIAPDTHIDEIVRFKMDEMFEIGLDADGSIRWHKN